METKYNFELIKDFLDGTLDSNAAAQISDLIQSDETARDIARGILLLKNRFETDEELETYLDKSLTSHLSLIDDKQSGRSTFYYVRFAAAVVFIAISSYVIYQFNSPSALDVVNQELSTTYPAPPTLRNSEAEGNSMTKAIQLYNSAEFRGANEILKTNTSAQAIFYSGLCHLYAQEYEAAIREFSKPQLADSRYQEQSQWFLAISLLKVNDLRQAKNNLKTIAKTPDHFKGEEAKRIMNLLDE